MTRKYIGQKIITAFEQEKDGKPGYGVIYADGYASWSPKDVFEDAYREIEGDGQHLTFGDALTMLKMGKKVQRAGWNGKDMWLSMSGPLNGRSIDAGLFWSPNNSLYASQQPGGKATVLPCITMKTATGEILMGWLASQTDMLAEDWRVLDFHSH